ncbi:glutamate mutase L, partial [Actinoplanes xinjiangensis]|uniref:glutamate mutase L n=1 Tax=Actinoplanes xinjiangensis TaxID=512350 RepID=UPI00344A65BD
MTTAVCVDVGSTYTKAAKIDLDGAELIRRAEVPTTGSSDVLEGLDAAVGAAGGGAPAAMSGAAGGGRAPGRERGGQSAGGGGVGGAG